MSEIEVLNRRLDNIERLLRDLVKDKNLKSKAEEWMPEKEAAEELNYAPRTLRLHVKAGRIPIQYTDRNNRHFQYRRDQVLKFKQNQTFNQ